MNNMSDYISREAAMDLISELIIARYEWLSDARGEIQGLSTAMCGIADIPAADVVEVVRCKDCQYDKTCVIQSIIIEASILPFDSNTWFCADGKRREDGANDAAD